MIRVEELSKSYGSYPVLDDVSFELQRGELLLLLGGNGAGKSTLLRCLLGLVSYQGSIEIDGMDPLRQGRLARRRIGYMPQGIALHLDLTVAETIRFYGELRRAPAARADRLLAEVDLEDKLEARVGELSGGMRQRLQFALSLLDDPPILLLDEPTASLDDWSRDLLSQRARELADKGKAVLLSTHARGELQAIADRALILAGGRGELADPRTWRGPIDPPGARLRAGVNAQARGGAGVEAAP
jgi:ABC-type multidrug transport system ATPase subunit